jgi:threonine dehydrogenase-like Zn-dependent dehydrogenase
MQVIMGQHTAGIFGYSHLVGGFDGGQAEYIRVPHADVCCLPVPDHLNDEQVLFLSDILCTGWHANELGGVSPGQTVAIFGCGPVGLMATAWARVRGAQRVIVIDNIGYRLDLARDRFGAETINFDDESPTKALREMTEGRGPDVCIEAAGFRYSHTLHHKIQKKLKLESDAIEGLSDAIRSVRKGGTVSVIGDFVGYANQFPVGAMMEKGLTVRGGQVHIQKYWRDLLGRIESGEIDPTFVITHRMPLDQAAVAYELFDKKEDGVIKVLLQP